MKKFLLTLFMPYLVAIPVIAQEIQDKQTVNVKNSYLTTVATDKNSAQVQQVTVTNSFLVFIKTKACICNSTVQPEK